MGPTSAADLKDVIRIQRRALADDGYGNKAGDWVDLMQPRPAQLTPTRGGDQVIAARAQGTALFDCWLRYDREAATTNASDRVVDARNPTRTFNVTFAQDMDGARKWLLFQLEMGGADG